MEEEALSSRLTTQEKLLVSQAVYKLGAVNWEKISGLLENHPVINGRPKEWFDAKTVEAYYVGLMTEIGINVPAQDAARPQAKVHLRLAQTFYLARLEELKKLIAEHEQTFSRLMSETTAIKSGSMDKVIKDEIRAVLARKFGKKLLDSWVPDEDAVKEALEAGPLSAEEVKAVEGQEGEVVIAEPEKGVAETEIATSQDKNVEGEDVKAESAVTENVDEQAVEQEPEKVEQPQAEVTDIEMDEPTKEASPAKDRVTPPPQTPIEVNSPAEKVRESGAMSPASDLSSAPDDNDQDRPSSPIKQTSSKGGRASKRKASMQPRGAPVSKRSTRRRTTATPGLAGEDSKADEDGAEAEDAGVVETPATEPEAETPVPVEEEVPRRGRRTTKRESVAGRGNKKATSPASSTRQSSPIAPKRGQSASSAHSATPATEERRSSRRGPKGRGMRDEVVSKSVREQSTAADSVKGDEEEVEEENEQEQKQETKPEAEEEEEERPAPRTSRRGRRNASPSPVKGDEEDGEEEEEEERPSTRATRRTKDHTTPVPEKQKEVFTERKSTRRSTARGATHTDDEKPDVEDETTRDRKPSRRPRQSSPREVKANQKMLNSILDQISGHRNGNIFAQPVRPSDAPNYSEIIKRPMDLKTVRTRIREGQITTIDEFERDIMLIFANATMYNARGSQVHDMAVEMMKDAEGHIKHLKNVQAHISR